MLIIPISFSIAAALFGFLQANIPCNITLMILAKVRKMATTMLTAITIQCHERRLSSRGRNDGVGTEATIEIRMQTIANQLSNNNHKSPNKECHTVICTL